jgi:hypothetical protein
MTKRTAPPSIVNARTMSRATIDSPPGNVIAFKALKIWSRVTDIRSAFSKSAQF